MALLTRELLALGRDDLAALRDLRKLRAAIRK